MIPVVESWRHEGMGFSLNDGESVQLAIWADDFVLLADSVAILMKMSGDEVRHRIQA